MDSPYFPCLSKRGSYYSTTGKCYRLSSTKTSTWEKGSNECKKDGGVLATIENQATQDFIEKNIDWDAVDGHVWLGGVRKYEVWTWEDGTPWTGYTNWYIDQPDDENADITVLNLHSSDKKWYDFSEEDYKSFHPFSLCQY